MGVDLHSLGHKNPKIKLDDGTVAWGCECWWGPEEAVRKMLEGKKIETVDMEAERKKAAEHWAKKNGTT